MFDVHTHQQPVLPGTAIVSVRPAAFAPREDTWYSVGIHPWYLVEEEGMDILCRQARHPRVLAIGEAGIDRLAAASILLQQAFFEDQARLADELGKPMVVHLVRAVGELLESRRRLQPRVPWIVHGFRGKAQLAQDLVRHGLYLSFGAHYQEEALRRMPADRLFLETDESDVPIADLYERAALVRGVTCSELAETVSCNVRSVFFGH